MYEVTVGHVGFKESRLPGQRVQVGSTLTLNVKLELGATTTVVDGQATEPRRVNLGLRIFF